uniref:Uncharacterized protein n=1 Tax=viral metagenome TaxID=1070528 RepID=A0A6H1ZXP9_9ZZZZ
MTEDEILLKSQISNIEKDIAIIDAISTLKTIDAYQVLEQQLKIKMNIIVEKILALDLSAWDKVGPIVRDRILEVQILRNILKDPYLSESVIVSKRATLAKLTDKLKALVKKKGRRGANRLKY